MFPYDIFYYNTYGNESGKISFVCTYIKNLHLSKSDPDWSDVLTNQIMKLN